MPVTDAQPSVAFRAVTVPVASRVAIRICNRAASTFSLYRSDSTLLLSASMSA